MPFPLLPELITDELTDLTPEFLKSREIELLMMDFDNTIVPYTTDIPQPLMEQWLMDMAEGDIPICVVSNSKNDRVKRFCRHYGIDCITHAKKPFTKGIRECLAKYGVMPILVRAIDNHNIWLKLRHVAELPFIFAARKRRINYEES